MISFLDFEKSVEELESKIYDLRQLIDSNDQKGGIDIEDEVARLQTKAEEILRTTYSNLSAWEKVQVARHPNRPQFSDYVDALIDDFVPLAGDRNFAEDLAIGSGIGRFRGRSVLIVGHEKGKDTQSRVRHNFGMARPEGYRKATRLLRLADKFGLAVITLVDTQGAYPGVGAEERGQAEAIARCTEASLNIGVPLISCIVGEGGSGGAVALATGDRVLMLEHSIYSVISPEGCASILWRSPERAKDAAISLKLTAADLLDLKVVDQIIDEPVGGAQRDPAKTINDLGNAIAIALAELDGIRPGVLREGRRQKFLGIGNTGLRQ